MKINYILNDISLSNFSHSKFILENPLSSSSHEVRFTTKRIENGFFLLDLKHEYVLYQNKNPVMHFSMNVIFCFKDIDADIANLDMFYLMIQRAIECSRTLFSWECKKQFGVILRMDEPTKTQVLAELERQIANLN